MMKRRNRQNSRILPQIRRLHEQTEYKETQPKTLLDEGTTESRDVVT